MSSISLIINLSFYFVVRVVLQIYLFLIFYLRRYSYVDIFLTALSIKLKALLRLVFTKFLLSSLGSFLYFSQFSESFLLRSEL